MRVREADSIILCNLQHLVQTNVSLHLNDDDHQFGFLNKNNVDSKGK